MGKYVKFLEKNQKLLYVVLFLMILIAFLGIRRININPDFGVFMPQNSEYQDTLSDMNLAFGTTEQITIMLETKEKELTGDLIQEYRRVQEFIGNIENIEFVNGPAPENLRIGPELINPDNIKEDQVQIVKDYYLKLDKLSQLIIEEDRIYALFNIFPGENFDFNQINQIESFLEDNNFNYYITGDTYMQQKIIDYIKMILLFLPPLALILLLFVFKAQMGTLKATLISLLPAVIAAQWTMGIVGWSGREVSIVTVLAPIFTIVIGSADGLHFVSHVQDARSEDKNKIESIVETLNIVGMPLIITTVTSMVGFLSLLVMDTAAINDLAIFAATGIFLAGVVTWFVLPLVLTGNIKMDKVAAKGKWISLYIKKLWGKPAIVILIILILVSLWGAQNLKTEFNQLMIYRDYTEVHQGFQKIMEVNQGSIPVFVYMETDRDPLDPDLASTVLDFENQLINNESVVNTVSVYDIFAIMYAINNNREKPVFPDNSLVINMMYNMISQMPENPVQNLLIREENKTRMMVFPADLKNNTLEQIEKMVQDFNLENENLKVRVTGAQYLMKDLNQDMIANQGNTLLLAFFLIIILLLISLKKLKTSFIALAPIVFTVIVLIGFLGISGISLNVITATIFSITIGVGIDYAVHFTSVWQTYKDRGFNSREAVDKAYNYTSRPILANALGLAVGLSALLLSPLRVHLYVSVLMWVSMISGVFFSLSFLPTVLRRINDK